MDVRQHTTGGDGNISEQLVELLVVLDGQRDVAGDDAGLLVVAGGVAGELEDLGAEVLEDGGHVDASTETDSGAVHALLEVASHTSAGELKSRLVVRRHVLLIRRSLSASSFSFSCTIIYVSEGVIVWGD